MPKRLTITIVLSFLFIAAFMAGVASVWADEIPEASERPYKATTVDECIREKECVWTAFEKFTINSEDVDPEASNRVIRKWGEDIRIMLFGENALQYKDDIQKSIELVKPYFPYNIAIVDSRYNVSVVLTNSIEREFEDNYGPRLARMFQTDAFQRIYLWGKANIEGPLQSIAFFDHYTDNQNLGVAFSFVKTGTVNSEDDIKSSIFDILHKEVGSPDIEFSKYGPGGVLPTKLDLLMMDILYDPRFYSGQSYRDVQATFEQVYPDIIKDFLNMNRKAE